MSKAPLRCLFDYVTQTEFVQINDQEKGMVKYIVMYCIFPLLGNIFM